MIQETSKQAGESWDAYWQKIGSADVAGIGSTTHPGFAAFWSRVLGTYLAAHPDARILDVGSGNGAVACHLSKLSGVSLRDLTCVDYSKVAVETVTSRFPEITGIVADARAIPGDAECFDLITSQFGVEYAGVEALDEVVRLLAPGGTFIALMQLRSGAADRECSAAIDALRRTRECAFVQRAQDFLQAGFDAARGGDRTPYETLAGEMNPAIAEVEAVLTQYGEHVADSSIVTVYDSVQNFHSRIQHYAPEEVLGWLRNMQNELLMLEDRMVTMRDSALDRPAFQSVCDRLTELGVVAGKGEELIFEGNTPPFSWVIEATK